MYFEQSTSVHYQAVKFKSKLTVLLRFNNLHKISKIAKKLVTEVHRAQQTMCQKLIQTDREGWNVSSNSLMVYLSS